MADIEHYRKLERMYASAPTNAYFEPEMEVSEGRAVITIRVQEKFFHAAGAVHGATYFKALDDAAFFAVNSLMDDVFPLTVSFNIYMVRPVTEGVLRSVGSVVHRSRRLFVAEAELFDSDDKQVARGSGTFMPSQIELNSGVGYK